MRLLNQVNEDINSNKPLIENTLEVYQSNKNILTRQTLACDELESLNGQLLQETQLKNEFVTTLEVIINQKMQSNKSVDDIITELNMEKNFQAKFKALLENTGKTLNDLNLIVKQYGENESAAINRLLNQAIQRCRTTEQEMYSSLDLLQKSIDMSEKLNSDWIQKRINLEKQIKNQESRKCQSN